jgi:hypothetical protein
VKNASTVRFIVEPGVSIIRRKAVPVVAFEMTLYRTDGTAIGLSHGLTDEEAESLAAELIEAARQAREAKGEKA